MAYYIQQTGIDTLIRQAPTAPAGFTLIPDQLYPQVLDLLSANQQFRIYQGQLQAAPPQAPSPFHIYNFDSGVWTDPRTEQQKIDQQWAEVRNTRDVLLQQSDWTALPDVPLETSVATQWQVYRQALRDVTTQQDPFNIVWPVKP